MLYTRLPLPVHTNTQSKFLPSFALLLVSFIDCLLFIVDVVTSVYLLFSVHSIISSLHLKWIAPHSRNFLSSKRLLFLSVLCQWNAKINFESAGQYILKGKYYSYSKIHYAIFLLRSIFWSVYHTIPKWVEIIFNRVSITVIYFA